MPRVKKMSEVKNVKMILSISSGDEKSTHLYDITVIRRYAVHLYESFNSIPERLQWLLGYVEVMASFLLFAWTK